MQSKRQSNTSKLERDMNMRVILRGQLHSLLLNLTKSIKINHFKPLNLIIIRIVLTTILFILRKEEMFQKLNQKELKVFLSLQANRLRLGEQTDNFKRTT